MHDGDDHGRQDQVKSSVEKGDDRLPPLGGQTVDFGLRHGDFHIVIVSAHALPEAPLGLLATRSVDGAGFVGAGRSIIVNSWLQIVGGRLSGVSELL